MVNYHNYEPDLDKDDLSADAVRARKNDLVRARFAYRAPNEQQKFLLQVAHEHVMNLVDFLLTMPDSRDRALALTSLEDTRMRINKAIVLGAN